MSEETFLGYFNGRAGYQMNGTQAWYSNEDTGVYFSLEYDPQPNPPDDFAEYAEEGEPAEEWLPSVATFNMNYNRPSYFGLEAAPEVAAFVEAFDLIVDDPQIDGMGRGAFSTERFVHGWSKANEWACSAIRQSAADEPPLVYPREHLRQIWKWNSGRTERQRLVGESIFVPRINFGVREGRVVSFAIWPDAIPTLLPKVDEVLVVREQLARRRWFRRRQSETLTVPWAAIESALSQSRRAAEPLLHIYPDYVTPPANVLELVKRDWPPVTTESFQRVTPDHVLDAEFFASAAQDPPSERP